MGNETGGLIVGSVDDRADPRTGVHNAGALRAGPYERIERNTRRKAAADDTGATMRDLSRRMIGDLMVQALALAAMVVVAAMVFYVR